MNKIKEFRKCCDAKCIKMFWTTEIKFLRVTFDIRPSLDLRPFGTLKRSYWKLILLWSSPYFLCFFYLFYYDKSSIQKVSKWYWKAIDATAGFPIDTFSFLIFLMKLEEIERNKFVFHNIYLSEYICSWDFTFISHIYL